MTASKFPSNEPVRRVGRCCIEEPPGTWKAIMPPKQRGAGALCGSVFRTPTGHSFVPPVIGIGQCPFHPRRGASMWGCNIFYSFRTPSYPFVPAPADRANPGAPYPQAPSPNRRIRMRGFDGYWYIIPNSSLAFSFPPTTFSLLSPSYPRTPPPSPALVPPPLFFLAGAPRFFQL